MNLRAYPYPVSQIGGELGDAERWKKDGNIGKRNESERMHIAAKRNRGNPNEHLSSN